MYKSLHTKSKSDTDFHGSKIINDGISKSWKIFQNNISKDLKSNQKNEKKEKRENTKIIRKYTEQIKGQEECLFISVFEKILLFKKQIDTYFFRNKLPAIKFDLDNSLQIIKKKLDDLNSKLIKECPILSKSVLIDKLTEFSDVIKILIDTKPQEFYKEVKFVILSKFEKIRLEIFELLENLHENADEDTNDLQEINKIRNECKFNHGILFNTYMDMSDNENDDESENNINFHLTSEVKENIISVILPRKNQILQFIEDITHDILFSLTKFSYLIDYYSLSISILNMQLFKTIILYVEKNKSDGGKSIIYNDDKTLFLIELILILNRTFTKKSLIDIKKKINASESSIQNSMGKFILNNINELIPKCKGFDNNKKCLDKKLAESLFNKSYENFFFYKTYMKSYKNKKIELAKAFKFYYDLKLIFWKSVYTKMEENLKSPTICCRICEQNIPLNEFVLHVYYCKEQNNYYKKMNNIKSKIKKYINSLEIYRAKINQRFFNKENNFYKKNIEMNKILKIIQKEQNLFNIDKYNTNDFLHSLIKIYINENNKPNEYYEKNPDKLPIVSTLIYLTYFVYILNKKHSGNKTDNNNKSEDDELSEILGNILSYLIQILFNTEYLLEAIHCRTKSNRYLNNIHYSFLSSSNDSFSSSTRRYHSSKNVVFKEFKINNSQNSSMNLNEEMRKRNPSRHQTFCTMMEDIKTKFSFNKALLNQSQNNNNISTSLFQNHSDDDSSLSIHSSNSNNDKKDKSKLNAIKSKADLSNNFFEVRSISENKNDGVFNFFFNKSKNSETHTKDKKQINNFNNSCKTQRRIPVHKSSKYLLFENNDNPVKIENKFFQEKKHTINNNYESPISKDFFTKDKLYSNVDSCSGSNHNSENEKDKNDTNKAFNTNINYSLSAKTNNILKLNNEKKVVPSLFLKSDKILLNYQPNLTERDNLKKSLFRIQHNENVDKKEKVNKNFFKYSTFEKLKFEEKITKTPSEDSDRESKDKLQFEKIDEKEILRKNKKKKTIVEKKENNKNLVLIENNDSSKDLDSKSNESKDIKVNKKKGIKSQSLENKNTQLFLRNKGKNKDKTDNSEDSSYDNDDYFNKVIIEDIDEGDKKGNEDPDKDDSLEGEFNEYKQIIENLDKDLVKNQEPEQNWFNFDSNFFMNCDINVQNQNVVNIIKELLIEINNDNNGENENEKEDNNDENELDNSKSLINLNNSQNKFFESNIKFSNFKLVLPLAKGGYGTVGLYKKTKTGDLFAIKSVDINNMKEKKLSKTLQNERNILKGISSDYVVNSYFIFKDKVNYYFVMEYLPGGDVYNLLSSIILPFSTIQLIVAETLLAVYYLHSINIIHHDIKPENILITKDGHFKLSDFGLSKEINEKGVKENEENINNSSSYSNSSFIDSDVEHDDDKIEGTLFYMAPELFNNDYPIGKSIDYWAVGIVIFELFTFKVPFEAETQEKTKQNIIDYNINWEPIYSEEVSKNYKNYIDCTVDLIKKFLFFDPGKRWGDHNFKDIQNHEFFKGFDWINIKKIKNTAVLSHLKKVVEKNNNKIKELNKKKGENNDGNLICEVDLAYDESDVKFSQRLDNLQKRNNELIKMKFKKKEIKIEDDDKNFKNSLLFDLQ